VRNARDLSSNAKKVFLADQLAPLADAGFAQPEQLSLPGAWLAVLVSP